MDKWMQYQPFMIIIRRGQKLGQYDESKIGGR